MKNKILENIKNVNWLSVRVYTEYVENAVKEELEKALKIKLKSVTILKDNFCDDYDRLELEAFFENYEDEEKIDIEAYIEDVYCDVEHLCKCSLAPLLSVTDPLDIDIAYDGDDERLRLELSKEKYLEILNM